MTEHFHAIQDDEPNYYSEEFMECVRIGCPESALLKILTGCVLERDGETDVTLFTVEEELSKEARELPSDRNLLGLQMSGDYDAVLTILKKRVAIARALQMFALGEAYGPRKTTRNE